MVTGEPPKPFCGTCDGCWKLGCWLKPGWLSVGSCGCVLDVGSGCVGVVLSGVVRPGAVVAAIREKTRVSPAAPIPAVIVRRRRRARLRSRRRRAELSSPGPAILFSLAPETCGEVNGGARRGFDPIH